MSDDSRKTPFDITGAEFRELGHALIDRIGAFLDSLPERPLTAGEAPSVVRAALKERSLPARGEDSLELIERAATLMFEHSLFNSHPKFLGYITAPPTPIGILGDLLAAAANPNCGAWTLAPMATEIERQTVQWIAEMIGYPADCGGILVSGGNMANFVGFLAARKAKAPWDVSRHGYRSGDARQLRIYGSAETHTWIQKAADMYGLGTESVRWIETDDRQRMNLDALRRQIAADRSAGDAPFMVVGTAGSVSTGAIDNLPAIREICDE
ncbi:MAG TPA: pyridoxal-dependent decarboxylase, partial [candidate division Zixibacteria bacterium]|nr:pyridoxal-dependent decarboxylase [candidate division Zixibacteria bacterium]